jgi:CRP-like cAMP-binding protein
MLEENKTRNSIDDINHSDCCLINPEGWANVIRENIMQILIVYTITLQIFKIAYIEDGIYFYWDFWDEFVVSGFFILDILFNFFTPFYKDYMLITDTKEIWIHYFKTFLILDLISVFPFDLVFASAAQTNDSISTLT